MHLFRLVWGVDYDYNFAPFYRFFMKTGELINRLAFAPII
ncbi:hypothetical protein DN41_3250 [Vibrio cholerae]|nr:hypothetical protein DN41_3250 [Vibrio cholerae]